MKNGLFEMLLVCDKPVNLEVGRNLRMKDSGINIFYCKYFPESDFTIKNIVSFRSLRRFNNRMLNIKNNFAEKIFKSLDQSFHSIFFNDTGRDHIS